MATDILERAFLEDFLAHASKKRKEKISRTKVEGREIDIGRGTLLTKKLKPLTIEHEITKQKLLSSETLPVPSPLLRVPQPQKYALWQLPPVPKPPIKKIEQEKLESLKPLTAINLGKLDKFIQDNEVKAIECDGPDTKIKIRGNKVEETEVMLSEQEINEIIKKIALRAQTEIAKPLFRAQLGNLTFTAIITDIGSRFLIVKK